jgi:4-amino-4-deoxy-L-arabinose transferase-like glycosyltransferase
MWAVVALLAAMAALMWKPMREQSATADEPWLLGAGYTYCKGMGFRVHPDQTPLAKMGSALPLLFLEVEFSKEARALFDGRAGHEFARPWYGPMRPVGELFPQGRDNWYFWPWVEGDWFGQTFVYGGANNAEQMLFAGRLVQAGLTLLTGLIIALWTRQQGGAGAAVFALALWIFNPVALSHGHIIQTDAGAALMFVTALWTFVRFLQNPQWGNAVVAGLAFGAAVLMKLTGLLLLPIFTALLAWHWWKQPAQQRRIRATCRGFLIAAAYALILVVYAPQWTPAPPLPPEQAEQLGVPAWFQVLRPVLIPPDFFKAVALQIGTARMGEHVGYLFGEWSTAGWWHYYPAAFALKTPIPLLLLTVAGAVLFLRHARNASLEEAAPWIAAAIYLGFAMTNKMNIGVRHLLPMFPLLAVGTAVAFAQQSRKLRIGAWVLCGWLAAVALWAHPFYLEYFNEFVGGSKNGHKYLLDSNLDWGQDVKRLKKFLDERGIDHVYLQYFGVQKAIEYYKIPCTRVDARQARHIHDGVLVISAMALMQPEWEWLRQQHEATARIGYSLFVYRFGD